MEEESTDFGKHTREHSSALAVQLAQTTHRTNGSPDSESSNSSAAPTPTTDRSKLIVIPTKRPTKDSSPSPKLEISDQPGNVAVDEGDEEDEANRKFYCGIGSFRPKFLRIFSNAKFFTFLLCLYAFIQGSIVSGERLDLACFFPRVRM